MAARNTELVSRKSVVCLTRKTLASHDAPQERYTPILTPSPYKSPLPLRPQSGGPVAS